MAVAFAGNNNIVNIIMDLGSARVIILEPMIPKANINQQNDDRQTALIWALIGEKQDTAKLLTEQYKADVKIKVLA